MRDSIRASSFDSGSERANRDKGATQTDAGAADINFVDGAGEPERRRPEAGASGEAEADSTGSDLPGDGSSSEGPDSRALFVTRPADFSKTESENQNQTHPKILLNGVDSLDVGLFVEWDSRWPHLAAELERAKRRAGGTQGILFGDGCCLILPSGKPPRYRWHLRFGEFHAFIGTRQSPVRGTPNVLVSLSSLALWKHGPRGALALFNQQIAEIGGRVQGHKISRVDPCADLLIPGGLTFEFLHSHRVPKHRRVNSYLNGDVLETYYAGIRGADIQLRIYDKATEIRNVSEKLWFLDLWEIATCRDVWRVEYQLRRPVLKQFGINTLDDLDAKLPSVWQYLASEWFSLRLPDNENATRRTVHPFWESVQTCAERFGAVTNLERQMKSRLADPQWYVQHIAGCLVGLAVCLQKSTFGEALQALETALTSHFRRKDFGELYQTKSIQSGMVSGQEAA